MAKRLLSLLLCLILLLSLAAPAGAAGKNIKKEAPEPETPPVVTIEITNLEEFLSFAERCRLDSESLNLQVDLKTDLDLSGTGFEGIPIFCGSFLGNNHTISGLALTGDGSQVGLFRYLTVTAQVSGLKVKGAVTPGGSREAVGGIAGSSAGMIRNCSFEGTVSGGDRVGGIVGIQLLGGTVENCQVRGSVEGNHFVGGLVGENQSVIRKSKNFAKINTTPQENTVSLTDVTLDNMTGSESAATVTDIGGIAGSSSGVIRECVNRGDVGYQHMGYNIGGIAGTQSGYIVDCENHGGIRGRKEVGGIVGQMEPAARIVYDEDTLQILKEQLDAMGGTVSRTASNVQNAGKEITGQVGELQEDVYAAAEAISWLLPEDPSNPQLPSDDVITAAGTRLSESMASMTGNLNELSAITMSSMGVLSNNLHTLQRQINGMSQTLGNAEETLGGSIVDVSDGDTEEDRTGKAERCVNYGSVLADLNAGGIAGAIAVENDLDPEEDLTIEGRNSLNFESKLRAVILGCENRGTVTLSKQAGGGIVGWQTMGLVKNCQNTGPLKAAGASYIGGISGQSTGFIRSSYANCVLSGETHMGGIAGSASVVTDCRALVRMEEGKEKLGAILGEQEENNQEVEDPISGNYYLLPVTDLGGIDGISYDGKAQALKEDAFFQLEGLPEVFRRALVTFVFEDGTAQVFEVPTGGALAAAKIPALPEKAHCQPKWEGIGEADLNQIFFDLTFHASYSGMTSVIQSQSEDQVRPKLLLQGEFKNDILLAVEALEAGPAPGEKQTLLESWRFRLSGAGSVTGGRLLLPEECDRDRLVVLVRANGAWEPVSHTLDGSYVAFGLDGQADAVALLQEAGGNWLLLGAAAGGAVLVLVILLVLAGKKRKQKTAE